MTANSLNLGPTTALSSPTCFLLERSGKKKGESCSGNQNCFSFGPSFYGVVSCKRNSES
ncbi:hypothetical protein HanRHA438_Chr15g0714231 [Helianthus annuus]|uniref:Uncharacterized protein n=1 Tax=Helianthus annuus TaxID=4232 RepID=A0A251SD50_HELAN|nr:hypothetical protein HanXRQr2_Chr15g0701911 [Helianthus annuus]KAJ0451828.1 hypothetical protein HanHA300_Chr15g0572001 [Helianthus annuus]KAJ0456524.1 hypothetical protein HanIR_Chr15g0763401 [Helianthus annuus]KAJ0473715.1 hypothetical protein HanHA89_Chr15g0621501 [Helianthus annuus]KAJ0831981.1 hypothetical protein HanPSC8_Chr15g0673441 [Helianthus annuus]